MSEEQVSTYTECTERLGDAIKAAHQGVIDSMTGFNEACVQLAVDCSQLATIHGPDAHERTITKRSVDSLARTTERLKVKTLAVLQELINAKMEVEKMAARSRKFSQLQEMN